MRVHYMLLPEHLRALFQYEVQRNPDLRRTLAEHPLMRNARVYLWIALLLWILSAALVWGWVAHNYGAALWLIFSVPLAIIISAGYWLTRERVLLYGPCHLWPHLLGMRSAWIHAGATLVIESYDRCTLFDLSSCSVTAAYDDAIIVDGGENMTVLPIHDETKCLTDVLMS